MVKCRVETGEKLLTFWSKLIELNIMSFNN